jgi:hypothetical protein
MRGTAATGRTGSAEAAGDVVLGLLLRSGSGAEDLSVSAELDQLAHEHERGVVGDAGGLLHVVGDDDDRVVAFSARRSAPRSSRGDRVQGRAGLVHQQHFGLDGDGAGDAQALLLAAGQAERAFVQAVLDLVPQAAPAGSSPRSRRARRLFTPVDPQP